MTIKTLSYKSVPSVSSLPTPGPTYTGVTVSLVSDGNPYYCNGVTWVDLSTTGGLVPTSIKTANYFAAVNDLVRVDSSSGPFVVTLPASPIDGSIIGVLDVTDSAGIYPVLALPGNGTIELDSGGVQINLSGAYVQFIYSSINTNWKIEGLFPDKVVDLIVYANILHPFLLMGA